MWTRSIAVALLSILTAWPAAAQNAVNDWSLEAQDVITVGRSPASSEYLLALVHAAMYDAVVAIEGGYHPFRVRVKVDRPASAEAAAAAAAYHVLRQRVPASEPALTAEYIAYVSALPAGLPREQGLGVGMAVAMQWLELRANDRGLDSAVTGSTRQYARFSEVAEEVEDARVWAGIHFRFSTDDGSAIGRQVARLVTRHHFRPVKH